MGSGGCHDGDSTVSSSRAGVQGSCQMPSALPSSVVSGMPWSGMQSGIPEAGAGRRVRHGDVDPDGGPGDTGSPGGISGGMGTVDSGSPGGFHRGGGHGPRSSHKRPPRSPR